MYARFILILFHLHNELFYSSMGTQDKSSHELAAFYMYCVHILLPYVDLVGLTYVFYKGGLTFSTYYVKGLKA